MNDVAKLTPTTNDRLQNQSQQAWTNWPVVGPTVTIEADKPLKVAIMGTAPSSRMMAPFADLTWQIWGCSPGNMGMLPRCDLWVEIHKNLLWPENKHYGEPYLKWLNEQTFPIYMQDNEWVPRAMKFPKDELVAKYGRFFFTSSFAWMMALAIEKGAVEIALYGVDMASRDEYILQRPGGHYFMQLATSRGIKVSTPTESDLAQPPALYGFDDVSPFGRKIQAREQEIKGRVAGMIAERDKLNHGITYLQGALEDLDYCKSIWGAVGGS
jgi:hypothetical protein